MDKAFGCTLSSGTDISNEDLTWHKHWLAVTKLSRRHYDLPRGPCGRRYIDLLSQKIQYLSQASFPLYRLIVYSSVVLQSDKSARTVSDIRLTLDQRIMMWKDRKYDLLVQEAIRCNRNFASPRNGRSNPSDNHNHVIKVFTRLMLQGKVRLAMRWLTDCSKGHVLQPTDQVKLVVDGQEKLCSVVEALKMKHPSPKPPHPSTQLSPDHLPDLEELDITGGHVHYIAHRGQGSGGPGGCDSSHWQDVLLRYGSASRRLRDNVATLARHMANSIIDWALLQGVLASRLIALDKCPRIRPIGVGEVLRRVICKSACLVTCEDAEAVCGSAQLCAGM